MAVAEAITETVEVGKQDSSLLIGEFDDRGLVELDASSYTVVVRWQQARKEFVVGGEPLYLQIGIGYKILCTAWIWHHHQVVFFNLVAMFVENETTFTSSANQMHTGVAQYRRVHTVKVGGKQKSIFQSYIYYCRQRLQWRYQNCQL